MTDEDKINALRIAVADGASAAKVASEMLTDMKYPKTSARFLEIAERMLATLEETKPE